MKKTSKESRKMINTVNSTINNREQRASSVPGSAAVAVKAKAKAEEREGAWKQIRDSVIISSREGAFQGKKLGVLLSATAGSLAIPVGIATIVPVLAPLCFSPVGAIGALVLVSLEEKQIGVGKKLGALAGGAAGAGAGLVKGLVNVARGGEESRPSVIELPRRAPQGKEPWEPILPSMMHKAEKLIRGKAPEPSMAATRGETFGVTLGCMVGAGTMPVVIAAASGGPLAFVMGTMIGSLTGFVAGGTEENILGVGRAAGEVTARTLSWLHGKMGGSKSSDENAAKTVSKSDDSKKDSRAHSVGGRIKSVLKDGFFGVNVAIAEPLMSFLVDSSKLGGRLLTEKPFETMDFQKRPAPSVDRQRLVDRFIDLAGIGATYGQEMKVAHEIEKQLDGMKISWNIDKTGNLLATIPATKGMEDAPAVLFSSHMDTVSTTSRDAIKVDHGTIHTDERHILGGDDRAGIAEILEGLETAHEKGFAHPEVRLAFTIGEEVGLIGGSALNQSDISSKPTLGYVMDSTDKSSVNMANDAFMMSRDSVQYRFSQEDPIVQVALHSLAQAGIMPRPVHGPVMAGAGSDANTKPFNSGNVRSIALGTGVSDIHTPLERVKIDDLEDVAEAVVGLLTNSCDLVVDRDNQIVPRHLS